MIPTELKTSLEALSAKQHRRAGRVLFRRGDSPKGVYLVQTGKVRLRLEGTTCALPHEIFGPGSLVGVPASVSGEAYSLTAEVIENADLGFVSREKFIQLLHDNPKLSLHLIERLSEEIYDLRSVFRNVDSASHHPATSAKLRGTARA